MNIKNKVLDILKEELELKVEINDISDNQNLMELGMDSISCMRVIIAIEDEFEFEVDDSDLLLSNFDTIEDISNYIEKHANV